MTQTAELRNLRRSVSDLSAAVEGVQRRYGNCSAVARLRGDIERLELDMSEFDALVPAADSAAQTIEYISDEPSDPAMWIGVDDEGLGGWHAGTSR